MEILNFIIDEGLIMIPVLYVLAEFIKGTEVMKNKYIPILLLAISIILTPLVLKTGYNADNIVQAILVAGATVFSNELITQSRKEE